MEFQRQRNRSYLTPTTNPEARTYNASTGALTGTIPGYVTTSTNVVEEMTDVVTSNYFRLSNRGDILNHNMSQIKDVTKSAVFSINLERRAGTSIYASNGLMDVPSMPLKVLPSVPPEDPGMVEQAITEAHAKVKVSDFDLTVMAAELGESVRLIHDVGRRFLKVYKAVRKVNLKAMRGLLSSEELRNLWLMYRYGIRPLYYDLKGVHKYLSRHGKLAKRHTARANPKSESQSGKVVGSYTVQVPLNTTNYLPFTTTYEQWTEQNLSVRAGVLYVTEFSGALTEQLALLGVDRPLSSAWDLLPFSFIADWFIGIGPFIASWEPKPGCGVLASWTVSAREAKTCNHVTGIVPKSGMTGWNKFSVMSLVPATRSVRMVRRQADPALPMLPSSALKLDPAKLLDLAAIFLRLK